MSKHKGITVTEYVRRRLGEGDGITLLTVMIRRSFGASSFGEFWRYWNPLYGYYLYRLCYRPLRTFLPRFVCLVATFAFCGFILHDLPFGWSVGLAVANRIPFPFVTVWFVLIGIVVVIAEATSLNMAGTPFFVRASVNAGHLIVALVLTGFVVYLVY
jgi:hypothetical protein